MNSTDTPADQQWDDYWQNDSARGEVFVGADGDTHPGLGEWWQSRFASLDTAGNIIDLACGAGSVFRHLPTNHGYSLHGADISEAALTLLRKSFPDVETTVCSADELPFEDGRFDVVCSQFGVEYAGHGAFEEAARVLAPDGQLLILCHIKGGYIDGRNQARLQHAEVIETSEFIDRALELVDATYSGDREKFQGAVALFTPAERLLANSARSLRKGIHWHLYTGFRQLYERRAQYDRSDIDGWLEAMRADVRRNLMRLRHMCRSANNQSDMDTIVNKLRVAGCNEVNCAPLKLDNHDLPVAWALTARR